MEIRRLGDALLRSHGSSLTFLSPAIPSRCPSIAHRTLDSPQRRRLQRLFASSARSAAARSAPVTTSASPAVQDADGGTPEKTRNPMDWLAGTSSSRRSRFSSPLAQADNQASSSDATEYERLMNKGSSATDLLASLNAARSARNSHEFNINRMAEPTMPMIPKFEHADIMTDLRKNISSAPPPARTPMRLTPSTGRTVYVTPQIDVGRSFKLMEQLVGRNKIKSTFNYQRFHERPGLKRKRLKSSRWRKRFMVGFRAAVNRVKQLKKQGW